MTEFMIEKNVPLAKKCSGRKAKYPWRDLEIGDSFFVPNPPKDHTGSIINMAGPTSTRLKKKFVQRKENGVIRIWRIE